MASKVQEISVQTTAREASRTRSCRTSLRASPVQNRTEASVTMFKKKEFNVLWAIIGFFACWIPLIIYAIVYSQQSDETVVIRVGGFTAVSWSADRKWWSNDGTNWHDAVPQMPSGATLSDDGHYWWDGSAWCLVPAGAAPAIGAPAPPPSVDPQPVTPEPVPAATVDPPPVAARRPRLTSAPSPPPPDVASGAVEGEV